VLSSPAPSSFYRVPRRTVVYAKAREPCSSLWAKTPRSSHVSHEFRSAGTKKCAAMQDQQATLATLKAENAKLEARLARLEGKRTLASH
jgi:hypothetical protein